MHIKNHIDWITLIWSPVAAKMIFLAKKYFFPYLFLSHLVTTKIRVKNTRGMGLNNYSPPFTNRVKDILEKEV